MSIDIKDNKSLETGDIILFRGTGIIATILEYFGKSKYSHVGMILKNPKFLND
jgi:cell wall-associated NlpC family hydrolase